MNDIFDQIKINEYIEIHSGKKPDGEIILWDYLPKDIDLSKTSLLEFKVLGFNKKLHANGNEACVMIEVSPDVGWTFYDINEIDDWRSMGWTISNLLDVKNVNVYLVSIHSLNIKKQKTIKSNGYSCMECKEFYPYAESNMPDDKLLCYSCRSTCNWKYK